MNKRDKKENKLSYINKNSNANIGFCRRTISNTNPQGNTTNPDRLQFYNSIILNVRVAQSV